ncbi:MAG: hypothetical protein OYH77_00160 [Pseudomonadota bacterium]|nr:hypothetical protein [Pseudomonadota bacterium]
MQNLRSFYERLLRWERQKPQALVHEWPTDLREGVKNAFNKATKIASLCNSACHLKVGSTNQSVGNQVEKHCIERLRAVIEGFTISDCVGEGYPDKILAQNRTGLRLPLEVKATSCWDDKDTNRRVLTSSSKKLRQNFSPPIYHLLFTAVYNKDRDPITIDRIRLDFLEPTTQVNVRLEASVSHKILASSKPTNWLPQP